MIRSSMVYSALTLVSRFMGLARDLVVTARLGASATFAADAYNTALMFPNLFRRIFAEGAFAAAFVPAYSKALETDGEQKADELAADAMATLAAATIIITVIAQLAMPWLMYVISPGFAAEPAKFKLAVTLTQISMPYLPCMAIVAHLSGVLNARGRFVLSAGAPVLLNLIMLIAIWPQKNSHDAAFAASWAILAAGVAQAAVLSWGVNKSGAKVHWRLPRLTPEIKTLLALAVPGAIAASASQINVFVSTVLASHVNGARSWLATADRLYQLPLGLVGVAIGVALLPRLSRAVQASDGGEAQAAMDQAVVFAMALTLPAATALVAMPGFLIDGLFRRGEFNAFDVHSTAAVLFYYGLATPAFVLLRVLSPGFFARGDTKSPMRFALISVVVNVGLGIALFYAIGVPGIAAATAVASWVNVGQMIFTLRARDHYWPSAKAWGKLIRVLGASAALGLILAAVSHLRPLIEAPLSGFHLVGIGAKEIAVLGTCALAALVYPALLLALGGVTPAEVKAALGRKR
ncbi:MAG: murein biosynthesis integral membrane protein MurJ [Alphaproteobacteria bacterium]|nr:murein biosynthesis integral membrane protein MurJ [Alphaproteobacteria bacterium]